MTATAANNPAEWLAALEKHNVLRWRHGHNNTGLLLAPLLAVNGWQGDVLALMDALPAGERAVTPTDLLSIMGALGYRIAQEKRDTASIQPEDLPALFVPARAAGWRAGVVLREHGPYGLIWDDGRKQHRGPLPEGSGTLYRFERAIRADIAEQQAELAAPKAAWLKDFFVRFRPLFLHAICLGLIMQAFTLAMPLFSMAVYDRVIGAHAPGTLPLLICGVLGAIALETMLRTVRVRLAAWIGARSGVLVTAAMFERLLYLPAPVIEQASASSQLARIRTFETVRDFIASPSFLAMLEAPFLSLLIVVIAWLAGPVALVATGAAALYGLALALLHGQWQAAGHDAAQGAARRQQMLMDITGNLKALHAAGMSDRMMQRYKNASWQATRAQYRFGMITAAVQHMAGLMTVLAGVAAIGWTLSRVWDGDMTGGAMVATMILTWRVIYLMQTLCAILPHMEQIRAAAQQVSALMKLQPESHAHHAVLAARPLAGHIAFQNIGLRHDRKGDPIFVGLNADIAQGEVVAIYGANGSGKSSILRLMLGLYAPLMGSIRYDGIDHRQFDPRNLRRQIAYLPQAPELLPGTVMENLRLIDPLAPDYKLRQALLWADAWEAIDALPAGLNTRLGINGFTPSAGLAARICLARLYLSERPVVLCDELPAQLMNSSTGERFRRFLEESRGKRTVLFVTHREDWLGVADQVIWLKADGRPVAGKPARVTASAKTKGEAS